MIPVIQDRTGTQETYYRWCDPSVIFEGMVIGLIKTEDIKKEIGLKNE